MASRAQAPSHATRRSARVARQQDQPLRERNVNAGPSIFPITSQNSTAFKVSERRRRVYVEIPQSGCSRRKRPQVDNESISAPSTRFSPPIVLLTTRKRAHSGTQSTIASVDTNADLIQIWKKRAEQAEQRAAQLAREVACADRLAREAEEKLLAVEIRVRRCALLQLEDQFTCPLCFDIISAPYVLNGATCGHTFCASCILKWYLARMHDCGSWHENVVCPMCRSALIHTPDLGDNPRSIFYCPFTPNRVADTAIKTLVRKVATSGTLSTPGHEPTSVADTPTKRRRGKVSAKGVFESAVAGTDPGDPLLSWMDSQGANLVEWRRRGEEGQAAMDRLRTNWHRLDNADFVLMKETMGLCVEH